MSLITEASRPKPWDHLTTRAFVTAFDSWARDHIRNYTRRAFARWAGIASQNAITVIISGERGFSRSWVGGFAKAAHLDLAETEYLAKLVDFESCSDRAERDNTLKELHAMLSQNDTPTLAGDALNLLRNPLAWTLQYMLGLRGQDGTAKWFKSRLLRKQPVPRIEEALELLQRLKLAQPEPSGTGALQSTATHLESPNQLKEAQNAEFHRYVLQEAREILDEHPPEMRAFGSLTVTIPRELEAEFKSEVNRFGQMLLKKYGRKGPVSGELFRLNIQLYPLTVQEC